MFITQCFYDIILAKDYDMRNKTIEKENALKIVELLMQYHFAKTHADQENILQELNNMDSLAYNLIADKKYTPLNLGARIERAIKLDKYRPKNMSVVELAASNDLADIGGEFSTFDKKLKNLAKDGDKEAIRGYFQNAINNVDLLSRQFSRDWIYRLNNHKDLVYAARHADKDNLIAAYENLFDALNRDFCREYKCLIFPKIVTDWETSDFRPKNKKKWPITNGFHIAITPTNEKKRSFVRINITNVARNHTHPTDFFYTMMTVFAHEMHHALDRQHPRHGALGSQIGDIDERIYDSSNDTSYYRSATETSSYKIGDEVYKELCKTRF